MITLQGHNAVVCGVASKRSIAWSIAQRLSEAGANLAITYQNEQIRQEAAPLVAAMPRAEGFLCDVSCDSQVAKLHDDLKSRYGRIDSLIHSIAYAPPADLAGDFLDTSREGFRVAHDVSAYSLIALCRAVAPLMSSGGAVITLTYIGAERVVPVYKVMGVAKASLEATVRALAYSLGTRNIRVNAISAGPIQTRAARGISNFSDIHRAHAEYSPMRRNLETGEIADTALYLASGLAKAITGQTVHVDLGSSIMASCV